MKLNLQPNMNFSLKKSLAFYLPCQKQNATICESVVKQTIKKECKEIFLMIMLIYLFHTSMKSKTCLFCLPNASDSQDTGNL